ncbi:MAG: hypothetical protein Q8O32_02210 [bacterium]|nr:hypothetical protein [bacterium]
MLLENLPLFFERQEKNQLVFRTEDGQLVFIDSALLDYDPKEKDIYYLSFDNNKIENIDSRSILNDILDSKE